MFNSFMTLSYRNQSSDLQSKSINWFLSGRDLRYERGNRVLRGGSRAAAISKMERFVIIANGWKLLSQSAPSWMLQQP